MWREILRSSLTHVGIALKQPEEFALTWQRQGSPYRLPVWIALIGTAVFGTATYGLTMGLRQGWEGMLTKSALLTISAGAAWAIPLPALYVLNSLSGSRLRASTTLLAALVTTSWGGLALVASIPIAWFFTVAMPALPLVSSAVAHHVVLGVNLLIYAGVGVSMVDVFARVVERLEPANGRGPVWFLAIVGAIGAQLFYLFDLFA